MTMSMTDTLNAINDRLRAEAAADRIATAKGELLDLSRGLSTAREDSFRYQDPYLTPEGLQAKREALDLSARQAAAPRLEQLRAQVAAAADTLAAQASASMPRYGTDTAATARTASKWAQVVMRLDAGIPLGTVLAGADVDTALAIREYGAAWREAELHKAAGGGLRPAPDHAPLMRSIDTRLAELSGPAAVASLAAAHNAAGVAAYVGAHADHLGHVLAGSRTALSDMGAAIGAEYAERSARTGLSADESDRAGAL